VLDASSVNEAMLPTVTSPYKINQHTTITVTIIIITIIIITIIIQTPIITIAQPL